MEFGEGKGEEQNNNNERKMIRQPAPADADKWATLPEVPARAEMGYLHLSFEYHRKMLKVRVWQISDLLLPPPQISMIHSIFVRGYLIPDKGRKSQRRTEDIAIDIPEPKGVETTKTGIQHIFTPSSFKFRTPLLFSNVTPDMVKERSLQLEVCMTQKRSNRSFLMAMVHMPLRTAVRRPIREKYPLIPCMNITIPNNMRVYSAAHLQLESSKGPRSPHVNGRVVHSPVSDFPLTARDEVELEDVVSLSGDDFLRSHLSLCLDADSDDDGLEQGNEGRLREVRVDDNAGSGGSSTTTLNIPSSGDEDGNYNDDTAIEVVTDRGVSNRSTPIDMSFVDNASAASSKKKIIPNELLKDVVRDVAVTMPAEETVVDMDPSLPRGSLSVPVHHPVSSNSARRKIMPSEARASPHDPAGGGSEDRVRSEIPQKDTSQNYNNAGQADRGVSTATPSRKKIMVLPGEIRIPSEHRKGSGSSALAPSHSSTDSDGLSPLSRKGLEQSPLPDSAFSPASRPETPCWDFYDFAEDLPPEDSMESVSRSLEESLAQLRQEGIGSLQNLSKEPILPMDLKDDFDSLAVDVEQVEHVE